MGCHIYLYDKKGESIPISSIRVPMQHYEGRRYKSPEEALKVLDELREGTHCCENHSKQVCTIGCFASKRDDQGTRRKRDLILKELAKTIKTCDFGYMECC